MNYGSFGSGKTTFGLTFPKPLLIFDVDDRKEQYAGMEGVEFITYKDTGKRAQQYRKLIKDLRKYQDTEKYKTVMLDTATSTLRLMKNEILGLKGTGSGATEGLSLPQWGTVTERFEKIFDILRGYDCHMIVNSHDHTVKDEITGEIKVLTMIVGRKLPEKAGVWFDEIYYCFTKKNRKTKQLEYKIRTQRHRNTPARTSLNLYDDRGNTIPILDPVEPQNFNVILDKVKQARENPKEYIKKVREERDSS